MKKKKIRSDFKASDLPSNRKELFKDIFVNQYRVLLQIGFILLLCFLPLLLVNVYSDIILSSYGYDFQAGSLTEKEYIEATSSITMIRQLISIPCLLLVGLGFAGVMKLIKRLCYLDPLFLKEDFKEGVKDNVKQMLLLFFLLGVILALITLSTFAKNQVIVTAISIGISGSIIFPTFLLMIYGITTYSYSFKKCFLNCFGVYIKYFLKNILFYLAMMSPLLLCLVRNIIAKYVIVMVGIIVIFPLYLIILFEYSSYVFDQYINKEHFPEIYDKGIHRH